MTPLGGWWSAWRAYALREVDPRPLAATRIAVCVAWLVDLLALAPLGLVHDVFRPRVAGGFTDRSDPLAILDDLSPTWGGPAAWLVAVCGLALGAVGVAARPALVVACVALAQLGHLYPPGDRAIDRLLRTVLLLLAASGSHRAFALGRRAPPGRVPAWPADTIRVLVVGVYLASGAGKLLEQPHWLARNGTPVLYRILTDPLNAQLDPVATAWALPVYRALGWGTIALELTAPLLFTRHARTWLAFGAAMHLGIAATMDLGLFSWGMLALYPVLHSLGGVEPARPRADRTSDPLHSTA